jgi:hypothetical protein
MNYPKLYSKEELLLMAAPYFDTQDFMWATTDGQFFYKESKVYATGHASNQREVTVVQLYKSDYLKLIAPKEEAKAGTSTTISDKLKISEKDQALAILNEAKQKFENAKRPDIKEKWRIKVDEAQKVFDDLK